MSSPLSSWDHQILSNGESRSTELINQNFLSYVILCRKPQAVPVLENSNAKLS